METGNKEYYRYSEEGIKKRNIKLWDEVKSFIVDDISFKEKFFLFEKNIKTVPKCYCGNGVKFIDMVKGYRDFCSRKCMLDSDDVKNKRKETCLEKYGVDNPSKSESVKFIVKETNRNKFGVDYPLQSNEILEVYKSTMIEKYGVDNPSKIPEIREKAKETTLNRFGVDYAMRSDMVVSNLKKYFKNKYGSDNPFNIKEFVDKSNKTKMDRYGTIYPLQNKEVYNKMMLTNMVRYGVDHYTMTDEYKLKLKENVFLSNSKIVNDEYNTLLYMGGDEYHIRCEKCGDVFVIQRQLWRNRKKNNIEICLSCNPVFKGSVDEKTLLLFLRENYDGEIIENFKVDRIEIDVFLPDLKIGFEFNGLYWHSELQKKKSYHYDKYDFFKKMGIQIVMIWEDMWLFKKDLVKSMILNKIGKTNGKIYARNCVLKKIDDNIVVRDFLDENHLQGYVASSHKYGLYYKDQLVSIMTFGKLRKSLGQSSKSGSYEMLRFCNKKYISVIGGASRLMKSFLNDLEPNEIISYSLNDYSTGNLYEKLGFKYVSETNRNYFWVRNKIRYHRFSFRKDKLVREGFDSNSTEVEIMYQRGFFRIFDTGSKKWVLQR